MEIKQKWDTVNEVTKYINPAVTQTKNVIALGQKTAEGIKKGLKAYHFDLSKRLKRLQRMNRFRKLKRLIKRT